MGVGVYVWGCVRQCADEVVMEITCVWRWGRGVDE